MTETDRILILFASQTGNAQDVAERIAREAERQQIKTALMAMDAYNIQNLPFERLAIFIASTTGQGEAPSTMKHSWRFLLRKGLSVDSLQHTTYAVFGLGDSGYINYNVVAKKLDRRLSALGAKELLPRGLGDDQHSGGYETVLDPWLEQFWKALHLQRLTKPMLNNQNCTLDSPRFKVTFLDNDCNGNIQEPTVPSRQLEATDAAFKFGQLQAAAVGISSYLHASSQQAQNSGAQVKQSWQRCIFGRQSWGHRVAFHVTGFGPGRPFLAKLASNTRLTAPDHFQDTRHIEFSLGETGPSYQPGDVLSIFPWQDDSALEAILRMLGLSAEQRVQVELARAAGDSPCMQVRVGALLRGAVDIDSASPRRYFFEVLQHFATDELQKDRLRHFASAEGREDLHLYNQSERRTVTEVLRDFGSARLPLEWLLQICPRLQPRQFSLASSLAAHPGQAHITLAVVTYSTPYKRRRQGLCSSWLAALPPGATVPVWTERGVLRLPEDPTRPLVMIGPGTGIAPFRSFLEERYAQQQAGKAVAPSYLFFGCRSASKDFYYEQQLRELVQKGVLNREGGLVTAFSRDQPAKVYVTHRLAENAAHLHHLLEQGAHVFVSGSAEKMPQDVARIFKEKVLQDQGGLTATDAAKYLRKLEISGIYTVEAWT